MMFKSSILAMAVACLTVLSVAPSTEAHVGLLRPCARGSPRAGCPPPSKGQVIDYDLNAPIGVHGSKNAPLCKQTAPSATRTTVKAGSKLRTTYSIGASHGGGHCQWALSYDNKNWVVLYTKEGDCLKGAAGGGDYSVSVPIPKNAPNGKATFMWLWNNAVGNRELYSNCADIIITGGSNGGKLKGVAPLIANYGQSPLIPEFGFGGDDKRSEFAKRKPITISGPKN
ncbi:hypothetical protein BX616_006211 [Lobosporangium transversale]|uniref:Chitin-binding type-4 domain-containing protein n=1 Tax=Lobosporangium transversale TaxID=64571 RepID=A0A1Y2GR35_9FUNG|nr:hypothetical protein BCR41DRAFT_351103 [Lobosporangium transversale]KAF9915406.1 hypothetical protein BX616_006211 [Lobosporangium transversale]ORZ19994.1 hypothetical protein BCR41DRAFT_351103 [Lobosporangium transversale]|eukprot:XP_021882534.1 hypothetical protein BCR41DRAFT_351103 [Lobosporangium transversale]